MKTIINYHLCDTETDKKLGTWNNGRHPEAASYYEENLYITPVNGYYLHLVGGYESPARLGWGGRADFGVAAMGELIKLLSAEEADAWMEKYCVGK